MTRPKIRLWDPNFPSICQRLLPICQRVFQNSIPTHKYDQRSRKKNKKRSSLAEQRFLDVGGLQILSKVGSYFYLLKFPCPLRCKATNKAENQRFWLCNLWNFIAKTWNGVESCGLLLTQNDRRRRKLQDPWCWTVGIIESFCHWRHYLEQLYHTLEVVIDISNLCAFMSTHRFMRRQVR